MNMLLFDHPEPQKSFGFYRQKKPGHAPLQAFEFPPGYREIHPNTEYLYTDFGDPEAAEIQLEIDLRKSCYFAGRYYNHLIYKAMREVAHYRRRNFINSNQLWFRDPEGDVAGFHAYEKFVLKATVGRYARGPALSVMYDGHSLVLPASVMEYDGATRDLNYVLYRGHCFRYDDIPPDYDIDYGKVYPVVNRGVLNHLGRSLPPRRIPNKVKRYFEAIDRLKDNHLDTGAFKEVIPLDEPVEWRPVQEQDRNRLEQGSNRLVFGGGNTELIPFKGLRKHGPYRVPDNRHIRIFFVMHENDRQGAGAQLYRSLNGERKGVSGLASLVNMPMELSDDHLIFTNEENPYPEIAASLRTMAFDEVYRYLAIYLSPIGKDEQDPKRHRAYYRIKEELLKHGIVSQVVERESVHDPNFRYYMPNIATGILAKLGGVPWQLDNPPRAELIVGVGAFKPRDFDNRYVGNAFCFSGNGDFRGFECYAAKETGMLAGSIRKAVRRYVREEKDIDRLVIHYYKKMSYRERKPIMQMLHDLGLDIPVIVVSINKTQSRDAVLFDLTSEERLPMSGTYARLGRRTFLLCNNTRYFPDSNNQRSYPFPVKMRVSSTEDHLANDPEIQEQLVRQVYQFSRIYWKSVSQQSLPVTIKYPEMVARIFPYFESSSMPAFGKKSLWFL